MSVGGAGVDIMQAALASQSLHVIGAVVVDELLSVGSDAVAPEHGSLHLTGHSIRIISDRPSWLLSSHHLRSYVMQIGLSVQSGHPSQSTGHWPETVGPSNVCAHIDKSYWAHLASVSGGHRLVPELVDVVAGVTESGHPLHMIGHCL